MSHDTPAAHEDLYTELMNDANKEGGFVIETEEDKPDIEFTVKPADKPTRNKLRRLMPDGLLDGIELPDDIDDFDEIDIDDIDLEQVSISGMTFSEEATETWIETIAQHFEHEYYSPTEVEDIFSALDDEYFISAGSYLIELGASPGPVTGFREQ